MSEYLGSGLEDFEEELIHIDDVGQTKLWVMILWDSVERKLRSTCLSWESFVFLSNMFSFFLFVRAPCFLGENYFPCTVNHIMGLSNEVFVLIWVSAKTDPR